MRGVVRAASSSAPRVEGLVICCKSCEWLEISMPAASIRALCWCDAAAPSASVGRLQAMVKCFIDSQQLALPLISAMTARMAVAAGGDMSGSRPGISSWRECRRASRYAAACTHVAACCERDRSRCSTHSCILGRLPSSRRAVSRRN